MILKDIKIVNFRNYSKINLSLIHGINIIYGKNAQGKTNLLESIYVLALTKSHRFFIDNSLIKRGYPMSKIKGTLLKNKIPYKFEVTIGENFKNIKIDNEDIKKISDYISKMNVIIFYPEDLELIKGFPNIRRRFLNLELSQLNANYLNLFNDYQKILKMRNEYLKKISKRELIDESYFDILNNFYVEKCIEIYKIRNKMIERLNENVEAIYKNITGFDNFSIRYKNNLNLENYDRESIKTAILNKMEQVKKQERKLGTTMVGPNRDDIEFYLNDLNMREYASQGQQRIAIITLKLAEIEIFKKYLNDTPILLLDDVFSELDIKKRNNLLKYIDNNIQTIITTTDLKNINRKILLKSKLIEIENGTIKKIREVEINDK